MSQLRIIKFSLIYIALILLSLSAGWVSLTAASATSQPFPARKRPWPFNGVSISTDLDGDDRPDLITSSFDGHSYKIAIQFSSRKERSSFSVETSEPGIGFFICDVDDDNEEDIVIASATSLRPLAVYLGDGDGNFERDSGWASVDIFDDHSSPLCEPTGSTPNPATVCLTGGLPFDRFLSIPVTIQQWINIPVPERAEGFYSQILAYKFTSRGPPTSTLL